jgi:NADPH-dependent 2,4-dienoyl-CoA reductase/sulfur reductase-like enzyme
MTRYTIIGLGVAGIAAAETLRKLDRSAEIIMIGDDPHGFYSRPGLAYYLTDEIPEKQLYVYSQKDWKELKICYIKGRAINLNPQNHQIEIRNANPLIYDRLLLATGATAVPLNIPGWNLKGVVKLDNFDDARSILSQARRGKTAVVVGGGIISLELVEGLAARGVKVHYFLRGDRYWSNVLDKAESRIIENRLIHEGISLHYQTEIAEILGRGGKITGVRTNKGTTIRCAILATGIGVKPRMELARAAGLATERGILVNEYLQTSDPDIFAAGDVAQVFNPLTGNSVIDNLWTPGREQGKAAALNMAGKRQVYQRAVAVNVLRLAGVMLTIIGAVGSGRDDDLVSVARGSSETWLQLPNTIAMESGNELSHLRLMIGERTLLGALVLGEQKLSLPLQEMIASQTDISLIRTHLLQPGASLGQIVMDFWSSIKNKEMRIAA